MNKVKFFFHNYGYRSERLHMELRAWTRRTMLGRWEGKSLLVRIPRVHVFEIAVGSKKD